jgi:hypothetical protein
MRMLSRSILVLALLLAAATTSSATFANAACGDYPCWDLCEDELRRCEAEDDGTDIHSFDRCYEAYHTCTLDCPM